MVLWDPSLRNIVLENLHFGLCLKSFAQKLLFLWGSPSHKPLSLWLASSLEAWGKTMGRPQSLSPLLYWIVNLMMKWWPHHFRKSFLSSWSRKYLMLVSVSFFVLHPENFLLSPEHHSKIWKLWDHWIREAASFMLTLVLLCQTKPQSGQGYNTDLLKDRE